MRLAKPRETTHGFFSLSKMREFQVLILILFFPVFLAAPYTCYQCDEVNEAEEIIFGSGRGRREQGTIERGTIPSFGLGGRRTNGEPKGGGNQLRQAPPICFSFWFPSVEVSRSQVWGVLSPRQLLELSSVVDNTCSKAHISQSSGRTNWFGTCQFFVLGGLPFCCTPVLSHNFDPEKSRLCAN